MNIFIHAGESRRFKMLGLCLLAVGALFALPAADRAQAESDTTQFSVTGGTLAFTTVPNVPVLPGLTLNGQSQTLNAQMNAWAADDATGSGSGWNVNVVGDSGSGKSAVFKEYCTAAADGPCLTNGVGYVATGKTLAANSLTLNSTGAGFTALNGTTGTAPTHSCGSTCNVDTGTSVKVASAAVNAGMGTYQASGYSATSLALSAPTTVRAFDDTEKVYRVDLTWTLGSGP